MCEINENSSSLKTGDTIQFGNYDWLVLDIKDNNALIITAEIYFMCNMGYAIQYRCFQYEESDILPLLDRIHGGFTDEEKSRISKNLFLLSAVEVVKYFGPDNSKRIAFYKGKATSWWLIDAGDPPHYWSLVGTSGQIIISGGYIDYDEGVRPAMWIKI